MNHSADGWSYWVSLGGEKTGACVGSIWLLAVIVTLCFGVLVGYSIIARDWHRLERLTDNPQGKEALRSLRDIFILCAICGYGLVIVRVIIPAWSLTVLCLCCLNCVTWRYILHLKALKIVHRDANLVQRMKFAADMANEETPIETAIRCKKMLDDHLQRMSDGPDGITQDSRSL